MGPILIGFGIGIGFAAWSNRPTIVDEQPAAFVALMLVALWVAYRTGQNRGRGATAIASASAHSEAEAHASNQSLQAVNVYVADPEQVEQRRAREFDALDAAPWRGERVGGHELLEETDVLQAALEDQVSHEYEH